MNRWQARKHAAMLIAEVWLQSRRTGVPFGPLLAAHLRLARIEAQVEHEQRVAEIARNN